MSTRKAKQTSHRPGPKSKPPLRETIYVKELREIFTNPNYDKISSDFSSDLGREFSSRSVSAWFRGITEDIPAAFMDWARKQRAPAEPTGAVKIPIIDPSATALATPPDGCPNHGVCASFSRLLERLAQFVAASAILVDPDRRRSIERSIEDLTAQVQRELGKVQKASTS